MAAINAVGSKIVTSAAQAAALAAAKPASKLATPVKVVSSSSVALGGQSKPNLGLYSPTGTVAKAATPAPAAKAAAPAAPPKAAAPVKAAAPAKPEVLATNANGVVAGQGRVVVDINASDSGYDNKIYYSTDNFKTKHYIGIDNQTGSVDLGTFKPGTTIQFGIDNGQGDFFKTGAASANADKFQHAQTSKTSTGGVRIGFEDLRGGGDRDFNDAIINVRSVPVSAPPVSNPPASNGNRSGLGDGTNPGQGAGTANSPNLGTNNPGGG